MDKIGFSLNSNEMSRVSTCTILNRDPIFVKREQIFMTQVVDNRSCKSIKISPICIVPWSNCFFIVSGNHRYWKRCIIEDENGIAAWIINPDDRTHIQGDPLPYMLRRWKEGRISFDELCDSARRQSAECTLEISHKKDQIQLSRLKCDDAVSAGCRISLTEEERKIKIQRDIESIRSVLESLVNDHERIGKRINYLYNSIDNLYKAIGGRD